MERKINDDLTVNEVVSGCTHVLELWKPISLFSFPSLFYSIFVF